MSLPAPGPAERIRIPREIWVLVAAGVDKEYRGREKASDHAPVWVEIAG